MMPFNPIRMLAHHLCCQCHCLPCWAKKHASEAPAGPAPTIRRSVSTIPVVLVCAEGPLFSPFRLAVGNLEDAIASRFSYRRTSFVNTEREILNSNISKTFRIVSPRHLRACVKIHLSGGVKLSHLLENGAEVGICFGFGRPLTWHKTFVRSGPPAHLPSTTQPQSLRTPHRCPTSARSMQYPATLDLFHMKPSELDTMAANLRTAGYIHWLDFSSLSKDPSTPD